MDTLKNIFIVTQFTLVLGMAVMLRSYSSKLVEQRKEITSMNERYHSTLTVINRQLHNINILNEITDNERKKQSDIMGKSRARVERIQSDNEKMQCSNEFVDGSIVDRLQEHAGEIR